MKKNYIKWFKDVGIEDISEVGGKNASLGELFHEFKDQDFAIPDGFAITCEAYRVFLHSNKIEPALIDFLNGLDVQNIKELKEKSKKIRTIFEKSDFPERIKNEILSAYHDLRDEMGNDISVAVRSSATAEDMPMASFAGQQETFLNIQGDEALLDAVRKCFASLYTDRAISYRASHGFEHQKVFLSVGVQRMVRSDLGAAGVMFSIDTESGFKDAVLINASYGLGENIVNGTVNPDEYVVFKPLLEQGFSPIIKRTLGRKEFKLIYDSVNGKTTKNIFVPVDDQNRFVLSKKEILTLSMWACNIEKHYSKKYGKITPLDIEWAKDGITGELLLLQARPETIHRDSSEKKVFSVEEYRLEEQGTMILTGRSVGNKISNGMVRVIDSSKDLDHLKFGEVLVTDKTDPDWEPAMKRAAAIVTNRGGRTCHAAIVARELGIPAVVGTEIGTKLLKNNQMVTVSTAAGSEGHIYSGLLKYSVHHSEINLNQKLKTKLMLILGNPEEAFRISLLPNDGVGLVRLEFMISSLVKVHPMAIASYPKISDPKVVEQISDLTKAYSSAEQYFIDQLSEGVGMIAAAFYPKDVIVRMSDFKTNEYSNLIGGGEFEPREENPMLGFRGASRYSHPKYRNGFALECKVMKKVREEMGLKNLKIMIPFCRTVQEGKDVISEMAKNRLVKGENGLEVYMMCEIPSNVILAEDFCELFDGFSIGSNDLTQLILGVDRDSEMVAPIFDERNPAVLKMISNVIQTVRSKNKKIGICGQAPSDYPEFAQFLIGEKIDSISLNPDSLLNGYQQFS